MKNLQLYQKRNVFKVVAKNDEGINVIKKKPNALHRYHRKIPFEHLRNWSDYTNRLKRNKDINVSSEKSPGAPCKHRISKGIVSLKYIFLC